MKNISPASKPFQTLCSAPCGHSSPKLFAHRSKTFSNLLWPTNPEYPRSGFAPACGHSFWLRMWLKTKQNKNQKTKSKKQKCIITCVIQCPEYCWSKAIFLFRSEIKFKKKTFQSHIQMLTKANLSTYCLFISLYMSAAFSCEIKISDDYFHRHWKVFGELNDRLNRCLLSDSLLTASISHSTGMSRKTGNIRLMFWCLEQITKEECVI